MEQVVLQKVLLTGVSGGVAFYMHRDIELKEDVKINEKEEKYCIELMNRIAPLVDNMTNELYNICEEIENEENKK